MSEVIGYTELHATKPSRLRSFLMNPDVSAAIALFLMGFVVIGMFWAAAMIGMNA